MRYWGSNSGLVAFLRFHQNYRYCGGRCDNDPWITALYTIVMANLGYLLDTPWSRKPHLRNFLHHIGLWACLWDIFLMLIDIGRPNPLWTISLQDRWAWTVKECELERQSAFLHGSNLCSCLSSCSDFHQLWTAILKCKGNKPFSCFLSLF